MTRPCGNSIVSSSTEGPGSTCQLRDAMRAGGSGSIVLHELNDASSGMGVSDHKAFKFFPELMSAMGFKV
jgi:hypothetical protein